MPTSRTEPSLLYAVKQVELVVRARLDEVLRPHSITALQYTALTVLERRNGLTAAELARNSFVTTQSIADLIRVLERQELIERTRDTTDRRRVLITLSDAGRSLLSSCASEVRALETQMLTGLSRGEIDDLRRALNMCRASLASASVEA